VDSYSGQCFGHSHSGQLFWTRLFWTVHLDTVILDSCLGHSYSGHLFRIRLLWTVTLDTVLDTVTLDSVLDTVILDGYSGQLFWTRLFWTVHLDTVILDSCFGHSYSGQLFWTQLFWTVIFRTARQYFYAVVIDLHLDKPNPQSHPIKFLYSPKRTINRSPKHTLQYPLSTGLLAKGSNVPSLMEMAQVTSKTLNKVRSALEYRLQMCSFTNATSSFPPLPQFHSLLSFPHFPSVYLLIHQPLCH